MKTVTKLAQYKIAKNTSSLVFAQIASRALSIVYVAVLARYVGTQGIGMISIAISLNALLSLVVGPGLNTLMVRDIATNERKAATYFINMLFLRVMLGVPFILLTIAVSKFIGYPGDTIAIIYIYTVVYLFDTLGEIVVAVFQAFESMEYEAGSQIVRDLINVSLSLLAIYLHQSLLTIVFISLIAQICKFILLLVLLRIRFFSPRIVISFRTSKMLLISSLPFGFLLILHTVQAQLGIFVLSLYHTADTVGVYSAAHNLIIMLLFFPGAFSAAIFPNFSRLYVHAKNELQFFYQICFKYLLVAGFPLGLGTMLVGDRVILLVYGDEFEGSTTILKILAVFLFTLVGYSNGPLLNATGRQRFFAWTQGLAVCANGILCLLLVPSWGPVGAAVSFVLPGLCTFLVHSVACHRLLGLSLPWLTMGKILIATLFMGLTTLISLRLGVPWPVVVFIIAPCAYGLSILLIGIVKREEVQILAGGSAYMKGTTDTITP